MLHSSVYEAIGSCDVVLKAIESHPLIPRCCGQWAAFFGALSPSFGSKFGLYFCSLLWCKPKMVLCNLPIPGNSNWYWGMSYLCRQAWRAPSSETQLQWPPSRNISNSCLCQSIINWSSCTITSLSVTQSSSHMLLSQCLQLCAPCTLIIGTTGGAGKHQHSGLFACLAENNLSSTTMLVLWTDGIDANACFAVK